MTPPAPDDLDRGRSALAFLGARSAQELSSWLLETLGRQTWEHAPFGTLEPLPEQLQYLYDRMDETAGSRLREAARIATEQWRPERHGLAVLVDLAFVVARLRVSLAVPQLCHLVRGRNRIRGGTREEISDVRGHLVAVIRGFPPNPLVCETFLAMLYDPDEDRSLALHLFLAVSACQPRLYPEYLRRFSQVRDDVKPLWSDDMIVRAMLRTLAFPTVIEGLPALDRETRRWFLGVLQSGFVHFETPARSDDERLGDDSIGADTLMVARRATSGDTYHVLAGPERTQAVARWNEVLLDLGMHYRPISVVLTQLNRQAPRS